MRVVLPPLSIAVTVKSWRPGVVEIGVPVATEPVHDCIPLSPSAHENATLTTWLGVYTAPLAGRVSVICGGYVSPSAVAITLTSTRPTSVPAPTIGGRHGEAVGTEEPARRGVRSVGAVDGHPYRAWVHRR